jgi:hypothetical protein
MNRLLLTLTVLVVSHCVVHGQTPAHKPASQVDAVIELVKAKVPDSVIIKTIKNSGKSYTVLPSDVLRLQKAGASMSVIEAMVDSSRARIAPKASAQTNPQPRASSEDREPTEKELLQAYLDWFNVQGDRELLGQEVTSLQKDACARAVGKPGWVCDFSVGSKIAGIDGFDDYTGRFTYVGGRWNYMGRN